MKALIDGVWHGDIADTPELRARRVEEKKRWFRDRVTADGASGFKAEAGRYHLYVSYACPWAHRAILFRVLLGLEDAIGMSVVHPRWGGPDGWSFGDGAMSTVDHANGLDHLYEVYQRAKPDFTGKVTVPVLWDRETGTIVNNESGEIIRMMNEAFARLGTRRADFYPPDHRPQIDRLNDRILDHVCMGVYKAGFADTQAEYETAVTALFDELDRLEALLGDRPYLLGDRVTEADWHLFATAVRFDTVYNTRLNCNLKRLADYPALSAHTARLYALPGVAETVKLDHVKRHYYDDLGLVNLAIQPLGPRVAFA